MPKSQFWIQFVKIINSFMKIDRLYPMTPFKLLNEEGVENINYTHLVFPYSYLLVRRRILILKVYPLRMVCL